VSIRDNPAQQRQGETRADEVITSMTVRLVRPARSRGIAATAGFDSLYVASSIPASRSRLQPDLHARSKRYSRRSCGFRQIPGLQSPACSSGALRVIAPHVHSADGGKGGRAARRSLRRWASARTRGPAAPALSYFPAPEAYAALTRHMTSSAVRERSFVRAHGGDRRGRRHRHSAGRPQRPVGGWGVPGAY